MAAVLLDTDVFSYLLRNDARADNQPPRDPKRSIDQDEYYPK